MTFWIVLDVERQEIVSQTNSWACILEDRTVARFVNCIPDTERYIKEDVKFSSYLWAAMRADDRTSNACKSYHSNLSSFHGTRFFDGYIFNENSRPDIRRINQCYLAQSMDNLLRNTSKNLLVYC